ncbi:MAG: alpha/beta hydrolase [Culicoidibacterales bacterium]
MFKRICQILAMVLLSVCVVFLASTLFFVSRFTMPPTISQETLLQQLADQGVSDPTRILALGQDFSLTSPFGYRIDATLLPAEDQASHRYIILNHDFGRDKTASLAYYELFHKLDFTVIIYSSRAHGETGAATMSYGENEKYDLQALVKQVLLTDPQALIGLHGVGLGAATVLEYAEIASLEIDFYIAQGSFQDFRSLLMYETAKRYPQLTYLPLVETISWWVHFTRAFDAQAASPLQAIAEIPQPLLLIYGSEDPYLAFGQTLATAASTPFAEFAVIEGATAQTVYQTNPEQYQELIQTFIRNTIEPLVFR